MLCTCHMSEGVVSGFSNKPYLSMPPLHNQGHKASAKGNYGDAKDHGLAAKDHMNTAADHKKEANKVEAQRKVRLFCLYHC